jgi:PAS domain S-box-containing protein
VPAVVAMVMTGVYRVYLGGSGVWMGLSVIAVSGLIGIGWRRLSRSGPEDISLKELYAFGIVVHGAMLALMSLLPGRVVTETLVRIGVPVMIIYPVGTALLGRLMSGRHVRNRAAEALRESERNYREIFNATGEAIFLDEAPTGRLLDVNNSMLVMYGYDSKEEVLRGNIGDLSANVPPYTQEEADRRVRLAVEEGPQIFEWLARKKNGELFWVEVSLRSSTIGGQGRILAVVRDISERKRSEEALRLSEERWQFALEGSGDGVWDWDVPTGRVFYSDQWKRILGYEPREIGDTLSEWERLVHPGDRERVWQELQCHLRGAIPVYLQEMRLLCKDGSYKWILTRGKVILRDDGGGSIRMVGTHSDITDHRRLEEHLRQAQKMEAIGQLAGGVAHDFNNILTTIIGRIYLLQSRLSHQEDLLAHAEQIADAAERASTLTRSLLAFSREQIIDLRRVSLNDAVCNAEGLFSRLVREDIEIVLRLDESSPVVLADEGQLGQVLLNLVANARDAITHTGRIVITTTMAHFKQEFATFQGMANPGTYAVLSVEDNGTGMDEKTRARIFDPFFTTKEVGKGTGLGLAVVYGIIRQHNAHIDVRSAPGKGSTFRIYLPVFEGEADEGRQDSGPTTPRGRGTVLVAEDEDAVRAMIRLLLHESGYRVIEAVNGVDAVTRFKENLQSIDAVLLDVVMPRMNGREACDEIRRIRPEVKILFMSGYSGDILEEWAVAGDVAGFLRKPLRPREFVRQLQEALGQSAPPASP